MIIALIVACDKNRVIGKQGKMPWHLSEDLKRFKKITTGHSVIMGRKTFESIGRPLPHRRNIVISKTMSPATGVEVVDSIERAFDLCKNDTRAFVIGGGEIYQATLPLADELYLTEVDQETAGGDAYFPSWIKDEWEETFREEHDGYAFIDYRRHRLNSANQ